MVQSRILIVEDESIIAKYLTVLLSKHGYLQTSVVTTGEEAIRTAVSMCPDLVLMDIKIGGEMDGIATAGQIRKLMDVPIVFLTAYADKGVMARAMETKPCGYLLKPFRNESLLNTVAVALGRGDG